MTPPPPRSPVHRVLLLPLVALGMALTLHAALAAAGMASDNPIRIVATPAIGGLIVYFGLPGYPRVGRIRLAAMVAAGLLIVATLI